MESELDLTTMADFLEADSERFRRPSDLIKADKRIHAYNHSLFIKFFFGDAPKVPHFLRTGGYCLNSIIDKNSDGQQASGHQSDGP